MPKQRPLPSRNLVQAAIEVRNLTKKPAKWRDPESGVEITIAPGDTVEQVWAKIQKAR
jgi:hypothetical protein